MDSGIHREDGPRWVRWIRVSIARTGPARRDGSGNPSQARRTTGPKPTRPGAGGAGSRSRRPRTRPGGARIAHPRHREISTSRTDYAKTLDIGPVLDLDDVV